MKWLAISAALVMLMYSQKIEPRGIRNNNPGNIEYNPRNQWLGQIGSDGRYAVFDRPENGIRAIAKLLTNYNRIYGLSTVNGLISRWAPDSENNTAAYVRHVAQIVGVDPLQRIDVSRHMQGLVSGIILHENGRQPYSQSLIREAIAAA